MGPFIPRAATAIENADVDDRVRFIGPRYILQGGSLEVWDRLVRIGQVGTITGVESDQTVVVQWDHHQDGSETRRGPQCIDRVCLELF